MSENKGQSSRRTSSRKKSADRATRRKSQQKQGMDKQKPRYSVNAMDNEDIAPYYERLIGGMMLAGALLIGYGAVTLIGRLRGAPLVMPDSLGSVPIETVLIFAGLLILIFQEPASFLVGGTALVLSLIPRWILGIDNSFPLQNTILFIAVIYFYAQFVNFRRARERYRNLPEKFKDPDIILHEIASDRVFPLLGLSVSITGLIISVSASANFIDPTIYGNMGAWISMLGFSVAFASAVAYEDQRILSVLSAILSGLGVAAWLSFQLLAQQGLL